jgi:Flp pilus assembly protein TadG
VEFALLAPVFLALLLGAVETGRLMWTRSMLQFAAEEAARYALVRSDATSTAIEAVARANIMAAGGAVTVTVTSNSDEIQVQLDQNYVFLVQGLLPFGAVQLQGLSRMPKR